MDIYHTYRSHATHEGQTEYKTSMKIKIYTGEMLGTVFLNGFLSMQTFMCIYR